ncbi:MAG: cation diffusion facilitator family transporter [Planctomycetes bacterium]|nr:cation diffusion facilitator family transporter [Planctomycetota bacterium]MBU1518124.1 cation diffusion facilitator family transporter [Planctomycetota bacterium]MBU2457753.1 cation diffusion facilitator family transporter [Planctomycetota bacterium]MBU2595966.1 cation diffusion facilitator family transporter [Planctomycetota bacterium]
MPPQVEKNAEALGQIRRVTWIGLAINLILTAAKIIAGFLVSSMALIADGVHSLSDMITDFAVIVGAKIGSKKPDEYHPYGHGWAENFAAIFIALLLAILAGGMIYKAAGSITEQKISKIGYTVLAVAIISIVSKEYCFIITRNVAMKFSSSMVYANAWHHRSDAFSSIAVAIGAVASMFGFGYADQIATIIVGVMIIWVAFKILGDSMGQFTARAVNASTNEQITKIIASQSQIRNWHKLRTRVVGRELFMDLHILVDPELKITEAHDIAESLENELHRQITQPVNITVHIEPNK